MNFLGRYITLQDYQNGENLNIPELSIIASPVTPQSDTVLMWNKTTEEDRNQQCPETHPFAYDNVV